MTGFSLRLPSKGNRQLLWTFSALYIVAFGLTLLRSNLLLWDDSEVYRTLERARETFRDAGSPPWREWIELSALGANQSLFRAATFVIFISSGICFVSILSHTPGISQLQAWVAGLVFLLAPFNSARVAMITFISAVSIGFFFVGWLLLTKESQLSRWIGVLPLALAATNKALQTMILVPVAHMMYVRFRSGASPRSLRFWAPSALLLLPVGARLGSALIWPPNGPYAEYYSIRSQGLIRAILLFGIALILLLLAIRLARRSHTQSGDWTLPAVGGVVLALGAFPYVVGGHLPDIGQLILAITPGQSDWDSRHTATLGVGLGLLAAGFVATDASQVPSSTRLTRGVRFTLAIFLILNITFSMEYVRDDIKHRHLVEEIRSLQDLAGVTSLVVVDQSQRFNARGRVLRRYEWQYLFETAGWPQVVDIYGHQGVCNATPPSHLLTVSPERGRLATLLRRDPALTVQLRTFEAGVDGFISIRTFDSEPRRYCLQ